MGFGDTDKRFRLGLGKTGFQVLDAHAWIDQNRHGTYLEKSESKREEFEAGRHHKNGAHAALNTKRLESRGHAATLLIEFGKGVFGVGGILLAIMAVGDVNRRTFRLQTRHLWQMGGDVGRGRLTHQAFSSGDAAVTSSKGFAARNCSIIGITSSLASSRM